MQPVTVAISLTGIQYLLQELLGHQIAKALQDNLTAPDYTFQPGDFNHLPGGSSIENDYSSISISISGGQIQSFAPIFSGCTQGPDDNSQFTITLTVNNLVVNYPGDWKESYNYQAYTWTKGGIKVKAYSDRNGHHDDTYSYSIELPTLTILVTFRLAASSGGYKLTYVTGNANAGNPQPNIPGGSILNEQQSGACGYSSHIAAATQQQVGNMNWSNALAAALDPVFASIGESGQLGPVTFDFLAPGDTPLAFPTGGGIQIGAKGSVSVNGSAFPAQPPADLPFPQIPIGNPPPHATYFVQDYEVDALFWGFFQAGSLTMEVTKNDNLPDIQALYTDTYAGTDLAPLDAAYPATWMTAALSARAAPTTAFQTIYQINDQNLPNIQNALSTIWGQVGKVLQGLRNMTFSSQDGFENELKIISGRLPVSLLPYAATIEQYAGVPGAVVTHTTRCELNVPDNGSSTTVITFDVAQTFVMQELQLGVSSVGSGTGKTQSVIFNFSQPFDRFPKASFVSSTIDGIDGADFGDVWEALRPGWQNLFNDIGKAGLPLPRIPGFDFVFEQAHVDVKAGTATADGYLSITANVTYAPENLTAAVRQLTRARALMRRV